MASITSATSGLSNATSTWTGGVVPVVGDKVTIQHPGTNTPAAGTQYLLNGGHSAGATSIVLKTGTGTIVAGECVQFEHQLGLDEDGQAIYDNSYYKVTTGIAAPGTIVITPGLAYAMAGDVRVNNRGHVVELAADHTWGDDTSSTTAASNGIVVLGTLKASRSVSQTLTARGTCFVANGGTFDYGCVGDIIPDATVATLRLNDSAVPAVGKHALVCHGQLAPLFRIRGAVRTRNTTLTAPVAAGGTSISVADAGGWKIGDEVILASDTDDATRSQLVTLTSGSGLVWGCTAVTLARLAGCRVGNFSGNVTIKSVSATFPGNFGILVASTSTARAADIGDFRAEDLGTTTAAASHTQSPIYYGAVGVAAPAAPAIRIRRVASICKGALAQGCFAVHSVSLNRHGYYDCAHHSVGAVSIGIYPSDAVSSDWVRVCVYRSTFAIQEAWAAGAYDGVISDCYLHGVNVGSIAAGRSLRVVNSESRASSSAVQHVAGAISFEGGSISAARLSLAGASGAPARIPYAGVSFGAGLLAASVTASNTPSQAAGSAITAANGVSSDSRFISYYQTTVTDLTTRLRGTYSVKIQPKVANTAITYTFTLPAVAGVAQTIKGSLRFDATYGTATPPRIDLSGQGVTQSHTCAATADAWDDFSFTFTPTSTGDITATVTVQSVSTAGFAWLDGVYHYPMTQSVRHFGYLWKHQASQEADPSITVSEATALAYPVSINHATDTITLSGNVTARQIYEACMADLVQTANQGEAKHISTSDLGASFTTTYTVDVGAFAVTGPYTDSAGLHVNIRADNLLSGSRVQLYNVTDSTELLNTVTSGAGLVYPIVAPGTAKTIRLRVAKVGYLPIEAVGVLDGSSVSFLDSQAVDTVYNAIGIDGSTVTEFTPDYPNLQIDSDDADGQTQVQRVYAWSRWANTAADGIRLMHNVVQAQDSANFLIDVAIVDARFDNVSATPIVISGGLIRRSDGTTVIGNGSIQMDPGRAYVAQGAAAITVPAGERVLTLASGGGYMARG